MKRFICFAITVLCLFSLSAKAQLVGTERLLDNQWLLDDKGIWFGNLPDVKCEYDSHQDVDALVCGLSAESNLFVISQLADKDKDFNLTKPAYPAIRFMAPGGDPSKYIQIGHDGTNGVLSVGSGVISMPQGTSGNAATATALASNPTDCSANQFANAIAASGNLSCAALADADIPDALTISGGTVNNTIIGGSTAAAATVTTLNVNTSVGKLTLLAEDVGATCAAGEVKLDTGGATKELCYCEATDTWVCTTMTAGPTD